MTKSPSSQAGPESVVTTPTIGPACVLAATVLVLLVAAIFSPILEFEFINLDVPGQVIKNSYVQGLSIENVKHILTSFCVTSYYPVRTLSYAVDYQIWGLNPKGFKLTNILIHMANVILVFWMILRLFRRSTAGVLSPNTRWEVVVATYFAAIFAVHPVVVEPVTWVSGREELLMVLGGLGCFHFHLTARWLEEREGGSRYATACHIGAAFACAFACLSNAVGAVIPLLIVAWDLLMLNGDRVRRIVRGTAPLWVIGVATIVLKKFGDATDPTGSDYGVFSFERVLVVLRVYWLNLQTLFWPRHLSIDYWNVEPGGFGEAGVILGGLAIVLSCVVLWRLRRRLTVVFGLAWFAIALGPTSQIMPHHIDRADRFLYLPLVGLVAAVAVLVVPLGCEPKRRKMTAAIVLGVSILVVLSVRSVRQIPVWRTSVSLWEDCLEFNPANAFAHACLADTLSDKGRFPEAIEHYEISLQVSPEDVPTLGDYAFRLAAYREEEYRDYGRAIALAERGCRLSDWEDSRICHVLALAHMNYATALSGAGQFDRAIEHYRSAIDADPDYEVPLFNLAMLLATCSDPTFRQPDEAVRLAERACALVEHPNPIQLSLLAQVCAETGRSGKAMAAIEMAIRRAQSLGDMETVGHLRDWQVSYGQSLRGSMTEPAPVTK
jgi:tetratricopeptide (TPR) repeat protein